MRHINPVYKRELKQTARMKKTLVMLLVYNLLLACFGLLVFYLMFDRDGRISNRVEYSGILTLYTVMSILEFGMVLLIVPAVTAGAVAGEREKQTLDLLLSTKVSPLQIVIGKLAASISMVILLAVSSLPVLAIVFSIGGITLFDMANFLIFIIVKAIYIGSFGIFFSVCCKRVTVATVCSYSTMIVLVILLPILLYAVEFAEVFREIGYTSFTALSRCISGKRALLLLFNPPVSFISVIKNQAGRGGNVMASIGSEGGVFYFLSKHWDIVSLLCQLLVAIVLIGISAHKLNPLAKSRKRA